MVHRLEQRLAEARELIPRGLETEEEAVHDLRVALRRIRVLCRELGGRKSQTSGLAELAAGASGLFRALGPLRDLDILHGELTELALAGRLSEIDPTLLSWMDLERKRLRTGLPDAAAFFQGEVERFESQGGTRAVSENVARQGFKPQKQLRRRGRRLLRALDRARTDPSDERLHRARIRGKQFRYTVDATRPGKDPDSALESGLKKLQDALGAIQDAAATVARVDALAAAGYLTPAAAGPARAALADERERRKTAFLEALGTGGFTNLLDEVKLVAAKQGDGANGQSKEPERVPLEEIPGIGAAKARRLKQAGLASPEALKAASLDDLAAVKTIGPHQARLIKEYVEHRADGAPSEGDPGESDGKRFERMQSVLTLGAAVADQAGTLARDLAQREEGDAIRAGRQAERLVERLTDLSDRVSEITTKKLKGLRGELREAEGLLAKVLDLDPSTLKMNKVRKALKAHRKAIDAYLT